MVNVELNCPRSPGCGLVVDVTGAHMGAHKARCGPRRLPKGSGSRFRAACHGVGSVEELEDVLG